MAPGTWSAAGIEYALALASGATYCSQLRTALETCTCAGAPRPACSSEQCE